MSGLMSRRKGRTAEYQVRDLLREAGFQDAVRVPLSGASEGYKGDVVFTDHSGKPITIEVKSRKSSFTTLYDKYLNTVVHHPTLGHIKIWTWGIGEPFIYLKEVAPFSKRDEGFFNTLHKLKAGSDLLVVKDNNKPFIWICWDTEWEHS